MENLESLLPDTNKIKRWKVKDKGSRINVYLRLKNIERDYEPEELRKSLVDAGIPIDNIFDVGSDFKSFYGNLDKLSFYRLWVEGDRLGLRVFKNISQEKTTPSGDLITGYQGSPSEKDKFGRIPELLKVIRDYVALKEEKE